MQTGTFPDAAPRVPGWLRFAVVAGVSLVLLAAAGMKLRGRLHLRQRIAEFRSGHSKASRAVRRSKLIIGYNLDFPGDWSDAMPFLDLMHDARPWTGNGGQEADGYAGLDLDAHGWPKTLGRYEHLTAIVRTGKSDAFVGHVWVVSYRGEGALSVQGAVDVIDQAPGQIRFRGRDGNVWLAIDAIDPHHTGEYLRDITIVRDDRRALLRKGAIFNPDLLSFLAPYHSLRFMDWALTNDEGQENAGRWSERSTMAETQWRQQFIDPRHPERGLTKMGYPVEVMIALANQLHVHPHFNLPHRYDDEYARSFAVLVRDKLAPDLIATVEYSNEVWNWGFPQATYARLEAQKLWPGDGTGWLQFMGARASNMCRIWKDVFGPQKSRIRCVIAPQTGWPDVADASLDCPRWVAMGHDPCYKAADAVAITGYFNGLLPRAENTPVIDGWLARGEPYALSQAFRQLEKGDVEGLRGENGPATPDTSNTVENAVAAFERFRDMADQRGLGLYVYEGGTHFDHGDNQTLRNFLVNVGKDARMKDLYVKLFDGFAAAGGTVFNVWGGIGDGAWSNGASLMDRSHPKYQAVLAFEAKQR
jgi:hypothetical protein